MALMCSSPQSLGMKFVMISFLLRPQLLFVGDVSNPVQNPYLLLCRIILAVSGPFSLFVWDSSALPLISIAALRPFLL